MDPEEPYTAQVLHLGGGHDEAGPRRAGSTSEPPEMAARNDFREAAPSTGWPVSASRWLSRINCQFCSHRLAESQPGIQHDR